MVFSYTNSNLSPEKLQQAQNSFGKAIGSVAVHRPIPPIPEKEQTDPPLKKAKDADSAKSK